MATQTDATHAHSLGRGSHHLAAGGVSGFLIGAVFGGGVMTPAELMPLIASLYGLEGVVAGWLAHLVHSIVFGMLFAVVVSYDALSAAGRPSSGAAIGAVYGIGVWVVAAAIVMPLWVGAMTQASPPVPNINWVSFVGHLVYGVGLGALYPLFVAHEGQ